MMITSWSSLTRRTFLTLTLAAGATGSLLAQGVLTGRVTDQANGTGLSGARISVLGTTLMTTTDVEGRYRITGVPAGTARVRAMRIGYASGTNSVPVTAGTESNQDFALVFTPYTLDEIVVTATGDQAKRELGNAVSTVDVTKLVGLAPITSMADALRGRTPGVVVLPPSQTGGGARVRIRGNSSMSLSNNPIYIVDGVRVVGDVNSSSIGVGGTSPSRINDLSPEDIETYDVVRGPSASTLYGTDAANGVVVIKTKRGGGGRPSWSAFAEQGFIRDQNIYPTAYRAWRTGGTGTTNSTASNTVQCLLSQVSTATCAQDSVTSYNLWKDPQSSPNGTGNRNEFGIQLSGGDAVKYFLSSQWERELGVFHMPPAFRDRLLASRGITELSEDQQHPNGLQKLNLRANINAEIGSKADIAVSSGFVTSRLRRPQVDNNALGIGSNGFGGPGFRNYMLTHTTAAGPVNNLGWRQSTPDEIFSATNYQNINRTITSGTAHYRPFSWLQARGVGGLDFIAREDTELCRRDECSPFFPTVFYGYKRHNRTNFYDYTGDGNATASYRFTSNLTAKSIGGVQYIKENNTRNLAYAEDLAGGSTSISSGSIPTAGEATATSITLGYYVEQQVSFLERLYLTAAVRSDRNSAFGRQFKRVYYPKASLSYVLSDESFFPKGSFLSSVRLRAAYGASGRQPGGNDALRYFTASTTTVDAVDTPGLIFSALGNVALKPERTQELEVGFDVSLASGRINTSFTAYNKNSKDALVDRTLPPSAGSAVSRFENIGSIRNRGIEALIQAEIIDAPSLSWDINIGGSYNRNRIVSLGGNPPNRGTTNSDIEGFPIQSWWLRPYTYQDINGDGIIALSELTVGDTAVYVGPSLPVAELSGTTTIGLLRRKLQLQLSVDSWLGGYQLNGTERIRCQTRVNCRGDVDPKAPLGEQARAMAVRVHSSATQWGYVEKSDFLRFRELSVTYELPSEVARILSASRISITAAGRNLGLITNYSGSDPQAGYFGDNIGVQSDFQTQPPPTYYIVRLNVNF